MTYYAFSGSFCASGTSPDGDTIRFQPDHPGHVTVLSQDVGNTLHVRLEGIDAPELHYEQARQRRAAIARTRLLHRLGLRAFTLVGDTIQSADVARGWVIAKQVDAHGRVIGFVYRASDLPFDRDRVVTLDPPTLLRSANADMLRSGAAYHLAYTSLERALRRTLQQLAVRARTDGVGVWSHDATRAFSFRGLTSICERGSLVFPKLFRRCVRFCQEHETSFFARGFVQWLARHREHDDEVSIDGRRARLSTLLSGGRSVLRCAVDPTQLAFVPKG